MNALFRPGPMKYIPNYINGKHGKEAIQYDLPAMEGVLKETYGITGVPGTGDVVHKLFAGFSKGRADELRKAMGKKIREKLVKLKPEFIEGGKAKGHPEDKLNKVWSDWKS